MNRRAVGHLILVAWVATLAWLAARHFLTPTEERLERGANRIGPSTSFLAVLLDTQQVGTAAIRLDTLPTGFRYTEQIAVEVRDPDGSVRRLLSRIEASTSRTFRLRHARASWNDTGGDAYVLELREDTGSDTTLSVQLLRSPQNVEVVAALGRHLVLAGTRPFQLAASGRLQPGRVLATTVWYPLRLAEAQENLRVAADTIFLVSDTAVVDPVSGRWVTVAGTRVQAWRVEGSAGGLPATLWIDAQGRPLRLAYALGLTLERSPFEVNYTNYQAARREGRAPPLVRLAATRQLVLPQERPPDGPDTLTVLVTRSDGLPALDAAAALAGGRQVVSGDTVRIHWRTPVHFFHQSPGARPRSSGSWVPATDRSVLRDALYTALGAAEGADTVAALVHWVAQDVLLLGGSLDPAGPARTARLRRGSIEAKARLLAALLEVAGLPARVVSGVDLSRPDLPVHTWVEVWRDGWTAVDPATGSNPASPWLLRITEGAARPAELVVLAGALQARVLAASGGRAR